MRKAQNFYIYLVKLLKLLPDASLRTHRIFLSAAAIVGRLHATMLRGSLAGHMIDFSIKPEIFRRDDERGI